MNTHIRIFIDGIDSGIVVYNTPEEQKWWRISARRENYRVKFVPYVK